MKGLVFTEFFELVVKLFDDDMVDTLIDNTNPSSNGAYTAVGSYDYQELEDMVVELSKQTDIPVEDLLEAFGRHLASVFTEKFVSFFLEAGSAIALFREIDRHIHVEVLKLYPDAELPNFRYEDATPTSPFMLHYRSERNLHRLAEGLIKGSLEYYSESMTIEKKVWQEDNEFCCSFSLIDEASTRAVKAN
jgi:hypothetical protein